MFRLLPLEIPLVRGGRLTGREGAGENEMTIRFCLKPGFAVSGTFLDNIALAHLSRGICVLARIVCMVKSRDFAFACVILACHSVQLFVSPHSVICSFLNQ